MTQATNVRLEQLLDQREWIGRLARSLVRDESVAEDLAQETWLTALRRGTALAAPRAWLASVLRNHARQRGRGDARRRRREQQRPVREPAASTAEVVGHFETQRGVAEAVAGLAEPFRATVLLHYFEGLPLADIARRERVPAGTVRWRLHKAHALLRQQLAKTHGEDAWRAALLPLVPKLARRGAAVLCGVAAASVLVGAVGWFGFYRGGGEDLRSPIITATVPPQSEGATAPGDAPAPRAVLPEADAGAAGTTAGPAAPAIARPQRGMVVASFESDDGRPLDGVSLALIAVRIGGARQPLGPLAGLFPAARSGADGRVALELRAPSDLLAQVPAALRPDPGEPWSLVFEADAPAVLRCELTASVGDGEVLDLGVVTMGKAGTLTGRVVDAAGSGLGGVEVVLDLLPFPPDCDGTAAGQGAPAGDSSTRTREWFGAGEFTLSDVPAGPTMVWARKAGYRSTYRLVDLRDAEHELEPLVLQPVAERPVEQRIVVEVVDPDGQPAPQAKVHFRDALLLGVYEADDRGRVTIEAVRGDGIRSIRLAATDAAGRSGFLADVVPTGEPIRLQLKSPCPIEIVAHDESGAPVQQFSAAWRGVAGGLGSGSARFEAPGRARLPAPACPFAVRVTAPGFAVFESEEFDATTVPARIEARLSAIPGVHGRVIAGGRPVQAAIVGLLAPTEVGSLVRKNGFRLDHWGTGDEVETGEQGRFTVHPERPGHVSLLVRADGFAPALVEHLDLTSRSVDGIEVVLSPGGTIEGEVRDRDGNPVPRAIVGLNGRLGHARTVRADRAGRYRFEHVRPGRHEVRVTDAEIVASGHDLRSTAIAEPTPMHFDVEVDEGETARFDLIVAGYRLRGRLVGAADWRGWQAQLVAPYDHRTVATDAVIGAAGRFDLAADRPGDYLLRLRSAGGPLGTVIIETPLALERDDQPFECALTFGRLEAKAPAPLPGRYWLEWRSGPLRARSPVFPAPDTGAFCAPLVPAGDVRLLRIAGSVSEEVATFAVAADR